ncbi:MAG: SLBB domain-containing protein [Flavobacteriales bacterium]
MKKILLTSVFFLIISQILLGQTGGSMDGGDGFPGGESTKSAVADRIVEEIQKKQAQQTEKKSFTPKDIVLESTATTAPDSVAEDVKKKKKDFKNEDKNPEQKEIDDKVIVYGQSFFANGNLQVYKEAGHTKAPDNYILGLGDEINISIWGFSHHQGLYTINSSGAIDVEVVGRIYLRGMPYGEAKKLITSKFSRVYDLKNSQMSIELNYSKVIKVNIVGEVKNPGTYSVSSINSAFNVLAISGGLTEIGSVRNIIIKRNNSKVKVLDVYKFLQNPSPDNDFFLEDNDYIIVQPIGNVVKLQGEVRRPGLYELKEGEGVKELLQFAGGLAKKSIKTKARLHTYENDKWMFRDIELENILNGKKPSLALKDGDVVQIAHVTTDLRNFVSIKGAVNVPGTYQFVEGEKVLDLINKGFGVRYDTYLGRAYLIRTHPDNTKEYITLNIGEIIKNPSSPLNYSLKEFDEVEIYSQQRFADTMFVEIKGSVRTPVRVPYSEELSVQDLIFMAGGLLREASNGRIEISRISNFAEEDSDEPTRVIIETVAVSNDLELGKETPIKLQPNDIVFVRNTPDYHMQKNVEITGEVKYPGTYSLINKTERLSSLIERTGGLTEWAFMEGATLWRFNEGGDSTVVIMNLKALYKNKRKEFDYILQEGDKINIPETRNLITIIGAVKYPKVDSMHFVYAPYVAGKSARYFVKEYGGGFSEEAKRKNTYVESAGGHVKRTKNFGLFKIYPKVKVGDKIVVRYKEKKHKDDGKKTDWGLIISRTTAQLTGVLSVATSAISSYLLLKVAGAVN